MQSLMSTIFALNLALLFTHEMDAIHRQEWKMFIFLKDMPDEKAYNIFTILHIPLYTIAIFLIMTEGSVILLIIDVLLLAHTAVHFGFKKHHANRFNTIFSNLLIYGMGFLSLLHLLLMATS